MAGSPTTHTSARERADRALTACRDDPLGRRRLAAQLFGDVPQAQRIHPYARPMLQFLRWQVRRGVLAAAGPAGSPPGSPWWRAVNETLLRDALEADFLVRAATGSGTPDAPDGPSNPRVARWRHFVDRPTPATWFAAHNASVIAGYLRHEALAWDEHRVERFVINVTLVRLLYAQLLATNDRLALGYLAPLGQALSHPRAGLVERFIMVPRTYPGAYPLDGTVEDYLQQGQWFARLIDDGVIAPRLVAVYQHAAALLDVPDLLGCVSDGVPCYAWDPADHTPWTLGSGHRLPRTFARLTGRIGRRGDWRARRGGPERRGGPV